MICNIRHLTSITKVIKIVVTRRAGHVAGTGDREMHQGLRWKT